MKMQKENIGEISPNKRPLFGKINFILLGISVIILTLGFILLSGGGSKDPAVFSEAIFDTRRLVVAPIILLIGFVIPIVAIMFRANK